MNSLGLQRYQRFSTEKRANSETGARRRRASRLRDRVDELALKGVKKMNLPLPPYGKSFKAKLKDQVFVVYGWPPSRINTRPNTLVLPCHCSPTIYDWSIIRGCHVFVIPSNGLIPEKIALELAEEFISYEVESICIFGTEYRKNGTSILRAGLHVWPNSLGTEQPLTDISDTHSPNHRSG